MEKNSPKSEIDFNSEVTYGIVRKKKKAIKGMKNMQNI